MSRKVICAVLRYDVVCYDWPITCNVVAGNYIGISPVVQHIATYFPLYGFDLINIVVLQHVA